MKLVLAAQLFKGFADRTRLRILFLLNARELTGSQLAHVLRVPRGRVTRHLAYLHKSRLISVRHEGGEAYYHLRDIDDPLHREALTSVVPLLGSVEGLQADLERCAEQLGS